MRALLLATLFLGLPCPSPTQEPATRPADLEATVREHLRAGRYDDALDLLGKALDASPGSGPLHLLAAQALYLRGRKIAEDPRLIRTVLEEMTAAEEEARLALSALPDSRDARMILAQALYYQNRIEDAEEQARAVLEAVPNDGGASFLLGEIVFFQADQSARLGDQELGAALRKEARAHYRRAIDANTQVAQCWHRLGNLAAHEGDLPGALALYARSLALDAAEAPHAWLLAIAHQTRPSGPGPDSFIALYRKSAATRQEAGDPPGAALLLTRAGLLLEGQKNWPEARAAALAALELDPEGQWWAAFRAGWCSYWMNDREVAEKAFLHLVRTRRRQLSDYIRESASEGGTAAAMMHDMSATAFKRGRLADARDFSWLLALARGWGADWNNYAYLSRQTGRHEEAWEGYRRALELEPNDPRYLNDAGVILHYYLRRDLDLAQELYQRSIDAAERVLADRDTPAAGRNRAAGALTDARNNLTRLARRRRE